MIIKKEKLKDWKKDVDKNKDAYGKGVLDTAYYIMEELSKGSTPEEAREKGFKKYDVHSIMSAAYVATTVSQYSPRGEEWKAWAKKGKKFMVDWKDGEEIK